MTIERKTKYVERPVNYEWSLATDDHAEVEAFVSKEIPDNIIIKSEGFYWGKSDLEELRDFIDTLIEEGPWA